MPHLQATESAGTGSYHMQRVRTAEIQAPPSVGRHLLTQPQLLHAHKEWGSKLAGAGRPFLRRTAANLPNAFCAEPFRYLNSQSNCGPHGACMSALWHHQVKDLLRDDEEQSPSGRSSKLLSGRPTSSAMPRRSIELYLEGSGAATRN